MAWSNQKRLYGGFAVAPQRAQEARDAKYPKSFEEADRMIGYPKTPKFSTEPERKKIGHNTYLVKSCANCVVDFFGVKLHDTFIVKFYPDGGVRLDSGTWQTPTTRSRFRRCGFNVGMGGGIASLTWNGKVYTFLDGITINQRTGKVVGAGIDHATALKARRAALRAERKAIHAEEAWELAPVGPRPHVPYAWRWGHKSGGDAPRGNAPEAFARKDSTS